MTIPSCMGFQADHSLRANHRSMDRSSREIEPVTGFELQLLPELGQAKCDAAPDNINDLVIGVRMSGIDIARSIRPLIGMQALLGAELYQGSFSWECGLSPGGDMRHVHVCIFHTCMICYEMLTRFKNDTGVASLREAIFSQLSKMVNKGQTQRTSETYGPNR